MTNFTPVTDENIEMITPTVIKIAEAIRSNYQVASKNIISFTGPLTSLGERKDSFFLPPGSSHQYFNDSNKHSFFCNGLSQTKLIIRGKINHLLVRQCQDTHIVIDQGAISGISILGGKRITIEVPYQNTTSIEQASETNVVGTITPDTIILVSSSMDVYLNQNKLPVNVFDRGIFSQGKFYPSQFLPPDLAMLLV